LPSHNSCITPPHPSPPPPPNRTGPPLSLSSSCPTDTHLLPILISKTPASQIQPTAVTP
jgi:hypothetical protein